MKNPYLYLVLLVGWIFAGAWFWSNASCCNISNPLSAVDGATVVAANSGNLRFALASAAVIIPDKVKPDLEKITAYLKAEPGRTLNITGLYENEEKNGTNFSTLGLGRAEDVKNYFMGQGIAGSRIFTGDRLQDNLVVDNSEVIGPITYAFGSRGINIQDGDKFNAADLDNFLFDKSGFVHSSPLSDDLNGVMSRTAEYLKTNSDRSLKITGHYKEEENYEGILPNLGMARANDIKQILLGMGVAGGQIAMEASMDKDLGFDASKLYGGLSYGFFNTPAAAENTRDLDAIRKRLQANPIILYFETNGTSVALTAQQKKEFSDIIYYLDRVADGKLISSGHTDDKGSADTNRKISERRAKFIRDYISKNGINLTRILTAGYGPDQPIGDNATTEGRTKNRRVEVTLK